jgi:F0F1-type ATP synthase assembly protein I
MGSLSSSPLVDLVHAVGMSNLPPTSPRSAGALGAGLTLAVAVGLFAYGGLWLDAQFGTKPWLLVVCVACGIVGGILHLIRVLAPDQWPFGKSNRGTKPPR